MTWIDFALLGDEESLQSAIESLTPQQRVAAIDEITQKLGITSSDVQGTILRLLIERVRPLALPMSLWSRPVTASDDPRVRLREHFARLGVAITPERVQRALDLYIQFREERRKMPVGESDLRRCGFRCQHCGLAFCNEELARKAIASPFGTRGAHKSDPLKPHWNGADDLRFPTMDHHWPVSLYGDNRPKNLRVLCNACNQGKEDFLANEQLRPAVGLPRRSQLLSGGALPFDVFYAQLRRAPKCATSGQTALNTELTVRLVDPHGPPVLDNLATTESPGL